MPDFNTRLWQSNNADLIIPLSVKVYSGSMNGLMYKTDDSNTGKFRFKPVQSNFKPERKGKLVHAVQHWHRVLP